MGQDGRGLGRNGVIHFGSNSGYQAINLAYLFQATIIYLLGFNMQQVNGKAHFFGSHPNKHGMVDGSYHAFVHQFDDLAVDLTSEGVQVINCTDNSALHQFPKARLEDVL
jgi:hypothetical protein